MLRRVREQILQFKDESCKVPSRFLRNPFSLATRHPCQRPSFVFLFFSHSQFSSCSLLMLGVPAVYYHGTGSENASRAYTETPMQHVQRTALQKKCMKSTFTLDLDNTNHCFFSLFMSLHFFFFASCSVPLSFSLCDYPLLFS